MDNVGKKFEEIFKHDWQVSFPSGTIDRIYDSVSCRKSIRNICDFIGYSYPTIYYLECKTKKGDLFPFTNLTQYDDLVKKVGIKGVRSGVVLWFYSHDKIYYIPISTVTQIKKDGRKSISIEMCEKKLYNIIEIPSIKKRVYMQSDYSMLNDLKDGE